MIALRRFRFDDAASLVEAARESAEQVEPWMPWCHPHYSIVEARMFIASAEGAWDGKIGYEMAIVPSEAEPDAGILGVCGLNQLRPGRVANIGYWVRTSATCAGVATEAVTQLAGFAFAETELERLEIVVAIGNRASARVAEKAGAVLEAIVLDRLELHGRRHDAWVYVLWRSRFNL